jgi:hypothetical protein
MVTVPKYRVVGRPITSICKKQDTFLGVEIMPDQRRGFDRFGEFVGALPLSISGANWSQACSIFR